jgi:flagella basal body P-ring formation protein FlgA
MRYLAPASAAVERATAIFRATAEVDGTAIRLGDLADVRSPDAALARSLRELSVGAAPLVGGKSSFQAIYARVRVRSLGLKDEQVRFEGATQVTVTRPAQVVTGVALQAAARAAVEALAPGSAIESGGTLYDRKVSRGRLELKSGAPRFFSRSATVPVEVVLEGKTLETVTVTLRVVKKVSIVVASRALAAGTILAESDLELREVPETASGFSPVLDVAQAMGRQLTMTLNAGATVPSGSLKQVPIVRRGDRVTLICAGGGFTLACTGEALADGALGQTIRVKNFNSGLELSARVSGPGTLQVAY